MSRCASPRAPIRVGGRNTTHDPEAKLLLVAEDELRRRGWRITAGDLGAVVDAIRRAGGKVLPPVNVADYHPEGDVGKGGTDGGN